jgi:hypothetical protein
MPEESRGGGKEDIAERGKKAATYWVLMERQNLCAFQEVDVPWSKKKCYVKTPKL